MTLLLKNSTIIERYLAHEMAPEEQTVFVNGLRDNNDLLRELKLSQSIDEALLREEAIDFQKKIQDAHLMFHKKEKEKRVPVFTMKMSWFWYAAASMVLLCAVAATIMIRSNLHQSPDMLFSQYYTAENIVDLSRGDVLSDKAVIEFQKKNYIAASELFSTILEKDKSNIAVWFYYGISNIETKNYEKSIKAFQKIISHNDNLYIEHAQWYLGLCYLRNKQREEAISQFASIASDIDNFHHKEAAEILEKLKPK